VPNGTYYIRVRAVTTAAVSPPSNEIVVVIGAGCVTPGGSTLTLTQNTGGTVGFVWTTATGSPTTYIIEAGSAPGLTNLANADLGSALTTATFNGVPPGTYYVRVRARNACGVGPASNEVTLVVAGSTPPPGGSNKPVVENVSFPSTIPSAPGVFTEGTATIADVNGDMIAAHFRAVSVSNTPVQGGGFDISFGTRAQGVTRGTFSFQLGCSTQSTRNCSGTTVMRLTVEDAAGNISDPRDFTFTYQ
jgi:hypothetical protein